MTDGHTEKRTLHELAHYPPHAPRASDPNGPIFDAARHHLIDVLNVGCWIGGATKDEIASGLPVSHQCHGAVGLEAHHHLAELAGLNAEDWRKVAADFPQLDITSDDEFRKIAESDNSLMILCSKHHRAPFHGIHSITEPVWKMDRYARANWEFQGDLSTRSLFRFASRSSFEYPVNPRRSMSQPVTPVNAIVLPSWSDPTSIAAFVTTIATAVLALLTMFHPGFNPQPAAVTAVVAAMSVLIAGGAQIANVIRHSSATKAAIAVGTPLAVAANKVRPIVSPVPQMVPEGDVNWNVAGE